ncbi:MAG TPA: lipase maturation factor family protein, partial [Polyangiales bacterium]
NASDTTLRLLPYVGMLAGLFVVYGGPGTRLGLLACYALYLSFDLAALMFPWDCLLFEAGILALFLPEPHALPNLTASALPLPAAAFTFQFLLIRLMWGFAKLKFIGTKRGDTMYLRGFLAWMPMCTPIGFAMQHAPAWFLRLAYAGMWFSEVVCPGLALIPGTARAVGALGLMGLMAGIWATGNWGFFNLGYGALCVALLDTQTSLLDLRWAQVSEQPLVHALLALHCFCAFMYFWGNSWGTHAIAFLPFDEFSYTRRWVRALVGFFRLLSPFRLFHGYGVFPANASPPVKTIPVIEGSLDGVEYRLYRYRFMPCAADSRPPFVAPHHPRIDHLCVYAGSGMSESDYMASMVGAGKPYGFSSFSHHTWLHRAMQRLLEGSPDVRGLFANDPFDGQTPKYCRVRLQALAPASLREARETRKPWLVRDAGVLFRPRTNNPNVFKHWLSPPELFHPDNLHQRRTSPALRNLLRAHAAGTPLRDAIRIDSDIRSDEVERFWSEFVPAVAIDRGSYARVEAVAEQLQQRFDEDSLRRMERIAERYVHVLRTRLEPYFFGTETPRIKKAWSMTLHLLAHEMILDGEQGYLEMLAHPERAAERAERTTLDSQIHFIGVVRNETLRYHGRTLRIMRRITTLFDEPIPGILEYRDLLSQAKPAEELWLPDYVRTESGEWRSEVFQDTSARAEDPALA